MPRVLVNHDSLPDLSVETSLFGAHGVEIVTSACRDDSELIAAAKDCDAIVLWLARVSGRAIEALPRLGIVSRYGIGVDSIDLDACRRHGVWVANALDYGVGEVATHALAMALSLLRGLGTYDRQIRAGAWDHRGAGRLRRVSDMTLGILGLGRIGTRMAHLSRDIFRRIVACDPYVQDGHFPPFVERVDLDGLFATADVVSLHVPLTDETRGTVNAGRLGRMRPGALLVNTARGGVVDLDALLDALDRGALAGAGLDVLPAEPPSAKARVLAHPRVMLSPHAAFYTVEAELELRRKAVRNVLAWLETGRPDYVVVEGTRRPPRQ